MLIRSAGEFPLPPRSATTPRNPLCSLCPFATRSFPLYRLPYPQLQTTEPTPTLYLLLIQPIDFRNVSSLFALRLPVTIPLLPLGRDRPSSYPTFAPAILTLYPQSITNQLHSAHSHPNILCTRLRHRSAHYTTDLPSPHTHKHNAGLYTD